MSQNNYYERVRVISLIQNITKRLLHQKNFSIKKDSLLSNKTVAPDGGDAGRPVDTGLAGQLEVPAIHSYPHTSSPSGDTVKKVIVIFGSLMAHQEQ